MAQPLALKLTGRGKVTGRRRKVVTATKDGRADGAQVMGLVD